MKKAKFWIKTGFFGVCFLASACGGGGGGISVVPGDPGVQPPPEVRAQAAELMALAANELPDASPKKDAIISRIAAARTLQELNKLRGN